MSGHTAGEGDGEGHAVVIGSGLAGLAAARALTGSMQRVTVIGRERRDRRAHRLGGAAPAREAHHLAAAGVQGLERLFPGVTEELLAAGMVRVRLPEDVLLLGPTGWIPRFPGGPSMLTGPREAVESVVRDRLHADPAVSFLPEHEAAGLRPGRDDTVTGVWVRGRDRKAPGGWGRRRLLPAEFVVDASGRDSRAPQWLTELGYGAPGESAIGARAAPYVTTVYARPVGHVADWTRMLLLPSPEDPVRAALDPVGGGRWALSLSLGGGVRPPADHAELLRLVGELRDPVLRDVLETATPLGPLRTHRRTENRWRHYERLRRWPDQFVVLGDALCALDPALGLGTSVAVDSALVLAHLLAGHGTPVGLAYRLRKALAHRLTPAWRLATAMETARSGTSEGLPHGPGRRLAGRYLARLAAAAPADAHAALPLLRLTQLLDGPAAAWGPRAVAAALGGPRRARPGGPPSATHGTDRRRPRPAVPPVPVIGVSPGAVRLQPRGSSAARWGAQLPTSRS